MFKIKARFILLLLSSLTILGCSQTPSSIPLTSQLTLNKPELTYHNLQAWQIDSQDLRVARHLIEIVDGDNVAKLINEQQSLTKLIEDNLRQTWTANQLKTAKQSDYKLDIQLVEALTKVTEPTMSYEVSTDMKIKIKLQHNNKTFVKLFQSNHQWNAPFSTSISRVTEQLETQLSQLLNEIIQDKELNDKLNQF